MKLMEKCGLAGICSTNGSNIVPMVINALRALQHRGQESWGIAIPGKDPIKRKGVITESIREVSRIIEKVSSKAAIGHVRYSTAGSTRLENAQPLDIGGEFSIAHNGTICNTKDLLESLGSEFVAQPWWTDTYLVGVRLREKLKDKKDWFEAFKDLSLELSGGYCFLFLNREGEMYVARDERGYRPLCIGWHEESQSYVAVSETCALYVIGAKMLRDVQPGEMIRFNGKGEMESAKFAEEKIHAHCAFEYTYFAHPSSVIEGVNVYSARKQVGRELAKEYKVDADVVIPVPDSARPAALGFSEVSGIPLEEGLMKDRYSRKGGLRSFIQPYIRQRFEINRWVLPVPEVLKGKDVVLVDDSIVRGTSSSTIIKTIKAAGAEKVTLLSTFPPIFSPCFMGIDFPTRKELVAYQASKNGETSVDVLNKRVAEKIGADRVGYNGQKALCRGIGLPETQLCRSCATGDYACLRKQPEFRGSRR